MGAQVAVAVVSTNMRDLLAATLWSLEPEHAAGRAEVWVVDNASTDGSPQMVERDFPWVRLITREDNVGYGRAVNLVADRTDTPWVAPANEDIELEPGALETLIRVGDEDPRLGVVAPRLILPDGSTQHSVFAFPSLTFTLLFNLGLIRLSRRLADRYCLEGAWNPERAREVPWAIATFVIVRRAAWDQVGGFDSEQFMHAEDLALSWQLARRGWRTRYEPFAHVRHAGSAATKKAFGETLMPRYMAATYGWMASTRGIAFAWAIAGLNVAGAGARFGFYSALARLRPRRFAPARDSYRDWLSMHRTGLAPRRTLMSRR